jgi:hypothetical protein
MLIGGKRGLLNIKIYLSYFKKFISHLAGKKVHSFTPYSEKIAFCSKNIKYPNITLGYKILMLNLVYIEWPVDKGETKLF